MLVHIGDLGESGYNSLEDWLLASERHLYIGRNLAQFLGKSELAEFTHTRKSPFVDEGLVKDIGCPKKLRLIKAIQASRFWACPYNNDGERTDALTHYKSFVQRTGRRRYAKLLEGATFACWCKKPMACHGQYLITMAEESRQEHRNSLAHYFSSPYVFIRQSQT